MKIKNWIALAILTVGTSAFAGQGGGNGQLVVVPSGHTKPVPYEVAKAWDTGVYRNFYKLPGINGNVEPRARFNREYAAHAVEWLDILKDYAPGLHRDLEKAAKNTTFRILSNYILWEHEPYPAGEVDYKKYEKAAFYNGDIILSTLVMDRIGPLSKVLTKEENQGFVVIHELINSAYRESFPTMTNLRLPIETKLKIGELIANIKILKWSKRDFQTELVLATKNVQLLGVENSNEAIEVIKELGDRFTNDVAIENSVANLERYWDLNQQSSRFDEGVVSVLKSMEGDAKSRFDGVKQYLVDLLLLGFISKDDLTNELFQKINKEISPNWSYNPSGSGFGSTKNDSEWKRRALESDLQQAIKKFNEGQRNIIIAEFFQKTFKPFETDAYANFGKTGIVALDKLRREMQASEYVSSKIRIQEYVENQFLADIELKNTYARHGYGIGGFDGPGAGFLYEEKQSIVLKKLYKAIEDSYVRSLEKLNIKKFYYYGFKSDDAKKFELHAREGLKFRFMQTDRTSCYLGNLKFNETYHVDKAGKSVKLSVLGSENPQRVGKKIKVDDLLVFCSAAELN